MQVTADEGDVANSDKGATAWSSVSHADDRRFLEAAFRDSSATEVATIEKLVAKGVRALLRKATDPVSVSRKVLRTQLEEKLGVADLSEWKETIKDAAVHFVLAMGEAAVKA